MIKENTLRQATIKRMGQICKSKRIEHGESQRTLAEAFVKSQTMICNFENGRVDSFGTFAMYYKRYGMSETEMRYIVYGE